MTRYFVFALVLMLPYSLRADDWPQFLGPRRDGTSNEKGLIDAFGKSGPKVLWLRDVGEGYSGPVIAGTSGRSVTPWSRIMRTTRSRSKEPSTTVPPLIRRAR